MIRPNTSAWLALALFASPIAFVAQAEATVVRALTLEEKTKVSPVVVHALVERVESRWEVEGARIETLVTLRVLEGIKGDVPHGEHLIVRQGGGTIGDVKAVPVGMAEYQIGEEVVLFLEPHGAYLIEIGVGIAKYDVERSRGEVVVTHEPNVSAVRISAGRSSIEHVPPMPPTPLATFLARVRTYAGQTPAESEHR